VTSRFNAPCSRDDEIRRRLQSNTEDPAVLAHIAECDGCRETLAVAIWMRALAETPLDAPALPDSHFVWWKAEIVARWEADRKAAAAMDAGEQLQVWIGLAEAAVLLAWTWRHLISSDAAAVVPISLTAVVAVSALVLAGAAAVALRQLLTRE
jgi:hypothetical protein